MPEAYLKILLQNDNNDSIIGLDGLEVLELESKNIEELPRWINTPKNLKELNISLHSLRALHDDIGNMTNLEKLNIRGSSFSSPPKSIGNLKNLKVLQITDAYLESQSTR